jgi:heat shock protein HspQ
MIQRPESEAAPLGSNRFRPGDLVRHRRYGYRGVVVGFDLRCMADEAWYQANQTQPRKDQPWYHVLVHGSTQATYAAETSLAPEPEPAPIEHPLVAVLFSGFEGGRYVRNDTRWPPA